MQFGFRRDRLIEGLDDVKEPELVRWDRVDRVGGSDRMVNYEERRKGGKRLGDGREWIGLSDIFRMERIEGELWVDAGGREVG